MDKDSGGTRQSSQNHGVDKNKLAILLIPLLTVLPTYSIESKGAIVGTIISSLIMAIFLVGLKVRNHEIRMGDYLKKINKSQYIKFGPFILMHSHHSQELCVVGKEFKIGEKYFCTGCYGIVAGLWVGCAIASIYLLVGLPEEYALRTAWMIPIFFIPITSRYTIYRSMKSSMRLMANALMAFGCWFLLIFVDHTFELWYSNFVVILIIVGIGYLRLRAAQRENRRLSKRLQIYQ